jgi:hypothetical protein
MGLSIARVAVRAASGGDDVGSSFGTQHAPRAALTGGYRQAAMLKGKTMQTTEERLVWRAYEVRETDMFGYHTFKYGVREEYTDGATGAIHNERFATREEAQILASRFNVNARKGRKYDNAMKTWS